MKNNSRDWPQVVALILACTHSLSNSLIYTWSSAFIPVLIQDYNISEDKANLLPIISFIGYAFAFLFFKIPDVIGRKYALLLLTGPQILYWLLTIFTTNIYWLYFARFAGGIGDALMYAILPIYVGEIATPKVRGSWGNAQTFFFNAGFFIISAVGRRLTIRQTAYVFLTIPIMFAISIFWLPESPYYYIMNGHEEKAKKCLCWLLRKSNVQTEFQQMKIDVDRQISETGTLRDLFFIKSNRKAFIACIFIRYAQQLSGIVVLEGYFQYIFEKAGGTLVDPQTSAMIISGTLWVVMTGFSMTLDMFGRKKSFIVSCIACSLCMGVGSLYFYIEEFRSDINLSSLQWVPLGALLMYTFFMH